MIKSAVFASGCFWGTQYYLGEVEGVIATTVGYIGGNLADPSYEQVSTGRTDHVEAVEVQYDSTKTNYEKLAKNVWKNIAKFLALNFGMKKVLTLL